MAPLTGMLTILVAVALLAGLVAVVTSVLGIPIAIRKQVQRPTEPAVASEVRRASARLLLAILIIAATGAALVTLVLWWIGGLLERLTT